MHEQRRKKFQDFKKSKKEEEDQIKQESVKQLRDIKENIKAMDVSPERKLAQEAYNHQLNVFRQSDKRNVFQYDRSVKSISKKSDGKVFSSEVPGNQNILISNLEEDDLEN